MLYDTMILLELTRKIIPGQGLILRAYRRQLTVRIHVYTGFTASSVQ